MNKTGQLVLLDNPKIDREKWDACINASENALIYALSWYLDIVSPGWKALVFNDYEAVMPLPVKRKYGITYLIQPYLAKQLGIFSVNQPDKQLAEMFFDFIIKKYIYINISISRFNTCLNKNFDFISRTNHELDLNFSYTKLEQEYSRRTKRNIKKAKAANITIVEDIDTDSFIKFKDENSESRLNDRYREIIKNIVKYSIENSIGKVIAAKNQNGEIVAAAFYLWFKKRIYFSVIASSEFGKNCSAMHLLLDIIIRDNAGSEKIFDFTGSDMKGVAYFNEGFGAIAKKYLFIYSNRIPVLRKFMK